MKTRQQITSRAQLSESKTTPWSGSLMVLVSLLFLAGCSSGGSEPSAGAAQGSDLRVSCEAQSAEMQAAMVELINQARSTARNCGTESMPAANPLTWNATLEVAAGNHSEDMATEDFFDHTGSNGLSVADRVTALGYQWSTVSENIAADQSNSEAVVQTWLDSSLHCANLMRAASTEVGVGCRPSATAQYDNYWTAVFAAPLN